MQDKNGVEIEEGQTVIVPEPNENDDWNFGGFSADVNKLDVENGFVVVVDGDGDAWCVEPERLEVEN